jgi:hypothetical protein
VGSAVVLGSYFEGNHLPGFFFLGLIFGRFLVYKGSPKTPWTPFCKRMMSKTFYKTKEKKKENPPCVVLDLGSKKHHKNKLKTITSEFRAQKQFTDTHPTPLSVCVFPLALAPLAPCPLA